MLKFARSKRCFDLFSKASGLVRTKNVYIGAFGNRFVWTISKTLTDIYTQCFYLLLNLGVVLDSCFVLFRFFLFLFHFTFSNYNMRFLQFYLLTTMETSKSILYLVIDRPLINGCFLTLLLKCMVHVVYYILWIGICNLIPKKGSVPNCCHCLISFKIATSYPPQTRKTSQLRKWVL